VAYGAHQENVIYYGTLQTITEHYVVLCSKIQFTDGLTRIMKAFISQAMDEIRRDIKSKDMELKAGVVMKLAYMRCSYSSFEHDDPSVA
jgi:hypothetical protein